MGGSSTPKHASSSLVLQHHPLSRDVQVWHCSRPCCSHRGEASIVQEVARDLGRGGHQGGQERWQVHHPRPLHAEDTQEASNQGRQEGGVRQGDDGQGQASHHGGQGILCVSAQEEHLRSVSVQ